jgi:hypothetical protein
MGFTRPEVPCRLISASALFWCVLALMPMRAAQAQSKVLREVVHQFVGLSGYWFTDSSADRALGNPRFGGDSTFYVRPARCGHLLITGGLELVSASDHWFIGGGNEFSLTGMSFRVSGERKPHRLVPFVTAGLFAGHIRSERLNFSETKLVPSMAIGAEIKLNSYITLTARYRISGHIAGVNTDGFSLSLKLF